MPADATFLERFASLGVDVNGLVVPGRSIERVLARHAFNLFVHNDHDVYKVSLVGSATAVRFDGRYLMLCTNHQLRGLDPQKVSMLRDDGSILISSGGFRTYDTHPDTDAFDIAAFDFTEPVAAHTDLKKRFFDLTEVPPDTPNFNVLAMLLTGFPSKRQAYELEERNHLGIARLNVVCELDQQPADAALIRMRAIVPLQIDPDGMSGGSAFVIQLVDGKPRAYFAGIVIRGGREFFYVLKPGYVVSFLRSVFQRQNTPGG